MKKKWLTGVFASVLVLGACGSNDGAEEGGGSGSGDTIEWRFGHLADENHIWHQTAMKFEELVEENSDGQMEIIIYPNNSLGGETGTINSIQAGTADMVIPGDTLQNWSTNAALMAVPSA